MLSYRHAFHAGNFADLLKHLVLLGCLDYLSRKPAPLLYVDSHAGAGRYALDDARARQTGEAERGVLSVDFAAWEREAGPEGAGLVTGFRSALAPLLSQDLYPGSPSLAAQALREQDRLRLFELHPADHAELAALFARDRRVRVEAADGFGSARALLPPPDRRVLLLVDPSYELKEDFAKVSAYAQEAARRLPGVCLLLWYPVLAARQHEDLARRLFKAGLPDLWRFELGLGDSVEGNMRRSGILALNPPYTLPGQLERCLPPLARQLAGAQGEWQVDCLRPE